MVVSKYCRADDIFMSFRDGVTGYTLNPFTKSEIKKEISNTFPEYYVKIHRKHFR